jgi:hypothetical protein
VGSRPSLLHSLQGLIERTYAIDPPIPDASKFLIGDAGYRRFYHEERRPVGPAGSRGAKTLIRETADGLRACIYYPDALIRRLEAFPPQQGLCEENAEPFATLTEELDHLLLIAERARQARSVTLFELELQADVTKHLVLARFLSRGGRALSPSRRIWLRRRLFETGRYRDPDPEVRRRYEQAARWSIKLVDGLAGESPDRRLAALRRFHRADTAVKLELISRL